MMAWFMPPKLFDRIEFEFHGLENLEEADASGRGVILCAGHFVCCEIVARGLGPRRRAGAVILRHKDPVFESWVSTWRSSYIEREIISSDIRSIVRALRSSKTLWYLPDQDLAAGARAFVPFFGVPTAALTGPARLARMSHALMVPTFFNRMPNDAGYAVHFLPALQGDSSGDGAADASRWYALLQGHVSRFPEQYLWGHRMFKTRPGGEPSVYDRIPGEHVRP
jgi:KDO2-lipid IV(A) lauroyltransferase